ncbi:hypothetical protein N7468_005125 [Penicillium chermesinum]|uniref:Uncharacterized protein n=1 Tax=Penicillium chermesinum TaxID=63820 RepID=A0A9W9NYM4_9EURO|nr:uncharacterized protein N7468_005125 [Penicillium chermesinum]KAJ5232169.1 hypothetical protein N7468_005125 [Penicillium chermesinum]KAJ6171831.1 hypothetical protein N7470_000898 [Penicillium chermesinum]
MPQFSFISRNQSIERLHIPMMSSSLNDTGDALLPCPTWLWSTNSDVNVAKDRSWFGDDYVPFKSFFTTLSGDAVEVVGIGSVDLPVQTTPTDANSNGTLRLNNVLHAPGVVCNLIAQSEFAYGDFQVGFYGRPDGSSRGGISTCDTNSQIAFFRPDGRFFEVKLSEPPIGPRVGPSPFKPDVLYQINAFWPRSERERFLNMQASGKRTDAENAWIKKHYGTEFKFLAMHGLSIYKEEDREEGRAIMRAFMDSDEEPMTHA